jgi:organic radical activating enzyme
MATDKALDKDKLETETGRTITLSRDPDKAMQQMMETIDSLREVYLEENAALEVADTQTFLRLQDRKIAAARKYQSGAEQLLSRGDDLQHINIALKQQLQSKQDEFSGIMSENLKYLDRLRKGVQRLNDRVMRSAREAAQHKNVNYSAKGHLNKNERAVSLGLSESV